MYIENYEPQRDQPGQQKSRLYWQCRRGMLELDSLLQDFFKQQFDALTAQQRASFELLLQSPDDLLLEYLMGRVVPMDAGMSDVVAKIRQSVTV
ncbi:MAG: succinate dehydrogenase assembly factor 2 [Gammaproteobacteria bacterium]|nr:succinate dehydrogenase assembly factor 2 [Gammaproteobacteria bacterium]